VAAFAAVALAACGGSGGDGGPPPVEEIPQAPLPPIGLVTAALSPTSIELQWGDGSQDEWGFSVQRSSDGWNFQEAGTTAANVNHFTDEGLQPGTTYSYRVQAFNAAGSSACTIVASATTLAAALDAPSGATATALSSAVIRVAWTDNAVGESGYEIERAPAGGGAFGTVGVVSGQTSFYDDTGLSPSTTYSYRVRASSPGGFSAYSNTVTGTTDAPAAATPLAPSDASATPISESSLFVTWTDHATDEEGFEVERGAGAVGPFVQVGTAGPDQATFVDSGLTAATEYHYRVRAVNAAGASGYSNVTSASTHPLNWGLPTPPGGLTAAALSSSTVRITWIDGVDEAFYEVERAPAVLIAPFQYGPGIYAAVGTAGANQTTYDDTGLTASTGYYYRVRGSNAAGSSAWVDGAFATTQAPVIVPPVGPVMLQVAAQLAESLHLTWIDTSSNETGFEIERADAALGPFAVVGTAAADQTSYDDNGLTAETTYYYRVNATNSGGDSEYSNTVSGIPYGGFIVLPVPPSNLTASPLSSTAVRLAWTDGSTWESGFRVERATSAGGPFATAGIVAENVTTFDDAGRTPATAYYYRVCATSTAGDSIFSATVGGTTQAPAPPAAPTGALATTMSASALRITWTDASIDEAGFQVERATAAGGPFGSIGTTGASQTTFDDAGLASATTYYYRVRATNAAGQSAYSNTTSATTASATVTHVELLPSSDHMVKFSTVDAATETMRWSYNENGVGCVWVLGYDPNTTSWVQYGQCASSVLKFDVSALAGKRIVSAALWLWAEVPPPPANEQGSLNATILTTRALAASWTPATLSWATLPPTYVAGEWMVASPTVPGPVGWSVTTFVQNWANGTWANNGLLVEDFYGSFPYLTATRLTSFGSLDYYSDPSHRPVLAIDYE
jgi:titin